MEISMNEVNVVVKVGIGHHFQKTSSAETSETVCMWERVKCWKSGEAKRPKIYKRGSYIITMRSVKVLILRLIGTMNSSVSMMVKYV